ncbi:unnamed protein product [Adineta steineri]|uniref:Macrocin O-methyltransferase n=1 Tax=Adineta steineri TaxID=433720 RepID=A0A816BD44_9BILA|nr:unnamed protein product [Adineta steineri]CAF1609854.1 unnamed protein product [Adineta steineri]
MVQSFTQLVVLSSAVVFIFIVYSVSNKSFDSSLFVSGLVNICRFQPLKLESATSIIRRVINNSSDDNEFFIFSDESPFVRKYLDVVRDTVCGLTLRTQDRTVGGTINNTSPLNIERRLKGEDWPLIGITMIGQKRLTNIEWALRRVIAKDVPGDFIECGVWRGGSSIFASAVLKALKINDRHVWLADSFQGLPKARTKNDNDEWSKLEYLKVSLEEVQTNFRSFDLLDDNVHFCKGYFVDSLPRCNISQIAVLRMDGDMYESTMDQLFNLYAKLQFDGVIIVDDYTVGECHRAVHDFRSWHNITEDITMIPEESAGRYWIKKKMIKVKMDRYKPLLVSSMKYTR